MLQILVRPLPKMVLVMLLLVIVPVYIIQGSGGELLAYRADNANGKSPLMLYDPERRMSAPVLRDHASSFRFSADGRLAFSSTQKGKADLYVLNTHLAHSSPIPISQNPTANQYPLAWSPDGRRLTFTSGYGNINNLIYVWNGETTVNITPSTMVNASHFYSVWSPDGHYLAFASEYGDNNNLIYVWDGETAVNITPQDIAHITSYDPAWDLDGRLAFTASNDDTYPPVEGDTSEIYLWDGKTTTNLSQNPTGRDNGAVWSDDGRIAFVSERDGTYNILVWDGVSVKNGSPDKNTFTNVSPGLTGHYFPTWTPQGNLAFVSQTAQDTHAQIYVWDGEKAINISQNPNMHNSFPQWSPQGSWAFPTFFSPQQLI